MNFRKVKIIGAILLGILIAGITPVEAAENWSDWDYQVVAWGLAADVSGGAIYTIQLGNSAFDGGMSQVIGYSWNAPTGATDQEWLFRMELLDDTGAHSSWELLHVSEVGAAATYSLTPAAVEMFFMIGIGMPTLSAFGEAGILVPGDFLQIEYDEKSVTGGTVSLGIWTRRLQ